MAPHPSVAERTFSWIRSDLWRGEQMRRACLFHLNALHLNPISPSSLGLKGGRLCRHAKLLQLENASSRIYGNTRSYSIIGVHGPRTALSQLYDALQLPAHRSKVRVCWDCDLKHARISMHKVVVQLPLQPHGFQPPEARCPLVPSSAE